MDYQRAADKSNYMKTPNYNMVQMRQRLILILSKGLNKDSKFYKEDYNAMVKAVHMKTRKELIEALMRWNAVVEIKLQEIIKQCSTDFIK